MVHQSFANQAAAKRDLILRVSREEFFKKGYHGASTDLIAKRAEIAKGSLFRYFGSKKNLYLYLVEQARNMLEEKLQPEIENIVEEDYFERLKIFIVRKSQLMADYPDETEFVARALLNPVPDVAKEIALLNEKYMRKYKEQATQNFIYNKNLLKKMPLRVDPEIAAQVSSLILEQISAKYIERYKHKGTFDSFDGLIEELELINDIIKYGVIDQEK